MVVAVLPAVIEALLVGSWLSTQSLSRRTLICQTLNHREVCWYGEHARDPVADRRRAAGVAGGPDPMPDAVQRPRRPTPARPPDPPRLLPRPAPAGATPHRARGGAPPPSPRAAPPSPRPTTRPASAPARPTPRQPARAHASPRRPGAGSPSCTGHDRRARQTSIRSGWLVSPAELFG